MVLEFKLCGDFARPLSLDLPKSQDLQSGIVAIHSRSGGPVEVYRTDELERSLTVKAGGVAKSSRPFPATTDAGSPLSVGSHDVEIADFPHPVGIGYGNFGTVWFRLGLSGDRSMTAGVLTALETYGSCNEEGGCACS